MSLGDNPFSVDLVSNCSNDHAHHLHHSIEIRSFLRPQRPAALGQVDPFFWATSFERGPEVQSYSPPAQMETLVNENQN